MMLILKTENLELRLKKINQKEMQKVHNIKK